MAYYVISIILIVALILSAIEEETFTISVVSTTILLPDIISKLPPTGIGASLITVDVTLALVSTISTVADTCAV
jgi:hypothetical protein